MNAIEIDATQIGDKIKLAPLMALKGLDLGGVELTCTGKAGYLLGSICFFDVHYLGVKVGYVCARVTNGIVKFDWSPLK
jgi:hypothetical protein